MELATRLIDPVSDDAPQPTEPVAAGAAEAEPRGAGGDLDLRTMAPRQQRRLILDELRAGRSDLEIGARFALSQWQVRNLRYRLGLKKDRGGHVPLRPGGGRSAALEQELRQTAARLQKAQPSEARPAAPSTTAAATTAARTRRLPRVPAGEATERMGVRLAGRFTAVEAGRRLSALGGLLAASDGDYEVRLAFHQLEDPGLRR